MEPTPLVSPVLAGGFFFTAEPPGKHGGYRGFQVAHGKESACNAEDARVAASVPRSGRSPGEENGNPLQYSCLGNTLNRGAWRATVRGVAKSQALTA